MHGRLARRTHRPDQVDRADGGVRAGQQLERHEGEEAEQLEQRRLETESRREQPHHRGEHERAVQPLAVRRGVLGGTLRGEPRQQRRMEARRSRPDARRAAPMTPNIPSPLANHVSSSKPHDLNHVDVELRHE